MSKDHPHIAVIDDEEPVRTALRRLLQSAGLEVMTFSSGPEFIASLGQPWPDCVVVDLHMPEMTGFELLRQIAAASPNLPLIAITGHDTLDAEEAARRSGAMIYLRKPVNDRVLLDAISAAITRAAQARGNEGQATVSANPTS